MRGSRIIVATVAWAMLSGPSANSGAEREHRQPEQKIAGRAEPVAASAPAAIAPDGIGHPEPCKPRETSEDCDLRAQWKAADAASDAAFYAMLSFVLGIAGAIGLFLTIWYTRRAVTLAIEASHDTERAIEIAARNADAASKLVDASERAAERQLRAYLSVEEVSIERLVMANEELDAVTVTWRNSGQTPARLRQQTVTLTWQAKGEPERELKRSAQPVSAIVAAGKTVKIPAKTGDKNLDEALGIGAIGVLTIAGKATYTDIFEVSRETNFLFLTLADLWEDYPETYRCHPSGDHGEMT